MGCCSTAGKVKQPVHVSTMVNVKNANKPVEEIKETSDLFERVKRIGAFKCRIVSLM